MHKPTYAGAVLTFAKCEIHTVPRGSHRARVIDADGRVVHETEIVSYGAGHVALRLAERWAADNGYRVLSGTAFAHEQRRCNWL